MIKATSYLPHLASRCRVIAEEISDTNGFVSVQQLANRFGVKILSIPLLVEATLASEEKPSSHAGNNHQWYLLVDSETHSFNESQLSNEAFCRPLHPRLRNTIAHELVHSLAFRPTEFGVELPRNFSSVQKKQEFLKSIEKETEKLSPLLLLPHRFLNKVFALEKESVSIEELVSITRNMGISRHVLINRLKLKKLAGESNLEYRPSITSITVGIGEWQSTTEAHLKEWPLFSNYEGGIGIIPSFVRQLQNRTSVKASNVFFDQNFYLNGGDSVITECEIPCGTFAVTNVTKSLVRCSIEKTQRGAGKQFLFLIQMLSKL